VTHPLLYGIAFAAPLAACSDRAPASGTGAPAAAEAAQPIVVRDPGGAIQLSIVAEPAKGSCTAKFGASALTLVRDGAITEIAGAPLAIERTPAGDQITKDGARVARLWRDPAHPGHVDILDETGVALARIDVAAGVATIADAGGRPAARVAAEGGRMVAKDPHDAVLAYAQTDDAAIAALVTAPLPVDVRAVAACDRLLPAPVSP
jgi:hypothetical protein